MAAQTLSKTAYVILGMLRLGKRTGYEIKSLVDVSTRFFWAASYGQIYPELARLEAAGLVRSERDDSDGRGRKAYELTQEGEAALHEWLLSPEPLHLELRHEGALKLFFSDALEGEERLEPLRQMRAEHQQFREQLEGIAAARGLDADEPTSPRLCLEWGIAYQEFMIDWCSKMERRLAAEAAGKGT
jgi:PadR family transcriptional regulator AphA